MISVITGDIINSKREAPETWLTILKSELGRISASPHNYEIYRGDSFQLTVEDATQSLWAGIKIKAAIKSIKNLDVRMAIGIGDKTYDGSKITESTGPAFVHSGEKFESLKKSKQNLAIQSGLKEFDREINLLLRLGLMAMDHWTPKDAQTIKTVMDNPNKFQEEIGAILGIKQNAVSGRLKRAYFREIEDLNEMFVAKLKACL